MPDIIYVMDGIKPDKKPAINPAIGYATEDRGETVNRMEPLLISETSRHRGELTDLAVELVQRAAGLRRGLPEGITESLSGLVRAMNCYYSNLIEGHDTHLTDIEKALKDDYSADIEKRNLQLEARAHIAVQKWIDEGGLKCSATAAASLQEIHWRFGELLPQELLRVENPDTGEVVNVVPGELRSRDVRVGRHVPVSPGAVPRFMERFESVYGSLGKTNIILASAAAHHRLLWIHPFLDGNGRVARLMSDAMLSEALDAVRIWSVSRGLARNEEAYKNRLMACDMGRRNDLDGRGPLSEEALADFTRFFLTTCIDQVDFMEKLMMPDRLLNRILLWTEEEIHAGELPPQSRIIMRDVLYRGEIPRGEVTRLLGSSPRHARRVTSVLLKRGILVSRSTRAPLRLAFPAEFASRWLPGLFPEK